ncbi:MAG: helix-turn-helix domain-containing protein [Solirubrobacterales bacterium]
MSAASSKPPRGSRRAAGVHGPDRYAALTERAVRRQQFGQRFGRNLQLARRAAGLSQDDLAERADMHRTEVSHIERGVRLPRADTLWRIAQCVGADLGELFAGLGALPEAPDAAEPDGEN